MSDSDYILAVDIGTGATKAVVFDLNLRPVSIARKHYPLLVPQSGWSEQEPGVIWEAVVKAMREAVSSLPEGSHILGVSLSSQLYSILAVNAQGEALSHSLTWSDTRGAQIAREFHSLPEAQDIYQSTGDPLDAVYPLTKIMWLQRNLALPQTVRFISIKEYIVFKLIGQFVVDWSVASASGLFNVKDLRWEEKALSLVNITPAQLSTLVSPRQVFHGLDAEVARQVGLPSDTPLVIGGGDGPLASLGVGASTTNILAVNAGTSAAARLVVNKPWVDPEGKLYTQIADEDRWIVGGVVSSGGIVFEWFLNNSLPKLTDCGVETGNADLLGAVEQAAGEVPAGAGGVIFVPYLAGEQCPGWDPETRGAFWGLDFRHQQGHLARAVLEGITYSIYRIVERIEDQLSVHFDEVRVTGGLTSSKVWLQIAADMFGYPIVVPETSEGSARGAAAIALVALGVCSDYDELTQNYVEQTRLMPRAEVHSLYRQQYETFLNLLQYSRKI